ncbi:FG-GAP repeat protein [Actinomadura kijaniata]|uniref:FG-GAP repeat protein n=1 Tax=Actinomadura kijaniata TaxID=46161 RepID=UPI003F19D80F
MRTRVAGALALGAVVGCGLVGTAVPAAARGVAAPYDFDGDGHRDLVVGSPGGVAGGKRGSGFVTVVPGSRDGLDVRRRKVVSQADGWVPGVAEPGDRFGSALASADLDRDGYADLAVGVPGEDGGRHVDAGGVTILWGSRHGLTRATAHTEAATPGARHRFGESLATGDIQGDGSPEVFVTIPGTSTYTWLYFGGTRALGAPAVGSRGAGDVDRSWVASGDVDGDGRGDVVYAWYDDDDPEVGHRRGFSVFHGTPSGGFTRGRTVYTTVHALAVGDFDGDRRADIAVGDTDDHPSAGGRVTVHRGGRSGLAGSYPLDQRTPGVPGTGVNEDLFGDSLAVGDVNGDGRADLAVGAPKADIGRTFDAGRAYLLFGSPRGLTGDGAQALTQNTGGVPGTARPYEHFGRQVSLLDHTRDGRADLTIGAPDEGEGGVTLLRGGTTGLTTKAATTLTPADLNLRNRNPRLGTLLGH